MNRFREEVKQIMEAWALLKKDLVKYAGYVNECIKSGKISFPVTQYQFDALTSFCYNCGKGNLVKLVTGRSAEQERLHQISKDAFEEDTYEFDKDKYLMAHYCISGK